MFKQQQELQRQKKPQELNNSRQQNVMGSLMHNKQSSGALYGLMNTGIPVRDPSQMFIFGDTKSLFGPVFSQGLDQTRKFQQVNSHDRCASPQKFDGVQEGGNQHIATLDPLEQELLLEKEDNSWGISFSKHGGVGMEERSENIFENTVNPSDLPSLQSGSWSALMQSAVAEAATSCDAGVHEERSGLSFQNPEMSNENKPSNEVFRFHKVDIEYTHGTQSGCTGFISKTKVPKVEPVHEFTPSYSKSSRLVSMKRTDAASCSHSPLNPMNYDPNMKSAIKNEKASYDSRVHQATAVSQPNSAFGDHMSPISSQLPVQDVSPDIITHKKPPSGLKIHKTPPSGLKNRNASKTKMNSMPGGCSRSIKSSSLVQVASNDQCKRSGQATVTNKVAATSSTSISSQHLEMANRNMVDLKSKKRKFSTSNCLPWHKEVTGDCSRLHDICNAELEWARSVNRLPEKLKEDTEVSRKKRLILTTRLMQLIFVTPPAGLLLDDATAHCDTVAYYAAKLALDDACSLSSGKCMTSKSSTSSDQDLSKTVEGFIDRLKSLEKELSRLEKGESSIRGVMVEVQGLEKFSINNRLAKFHTGGPLVAPDARSSGGPQKYVKTRVMRSKVPEGLRYLSL